MSLKNWDNKTWLSSKKYIYFFNNFLLKHTKINRNSKILDIGCGRAKIIGSLSSKLKLKNKPIGIDVEKFKDIDRRINFKKIDAIEYCKRSEKFDLILIKQSIHLIRFSNIQRLLKLCKKNLNLNGRILIFSLDVNNNEIPTFKLMKKKIG